MQTTKNTKSTKQHLETQGCGAVADPIFFYVFFVFFVFFVVVPICRLLISGGAGTASSG